MDAWGLGMTVHWLLTGRTHVIGDDVLFHFKEGGRRDKGAIAQGRLDNLGDAAAADCTRETAESKASMWACARTSDDGIMLSCTSRQECRD